MYDPYTEVFRIGTFVLWHKDPMKDRSDNSCGWTKAKLTAKENIIARKNFDYLRKAIIEVFQEWENGNELRVVYSIYRHLKMNLIKKGLSSKDYFYILDLCLNMHDDLTIHASSNINDDFERFYMNIARLIKTKYRKWYNHPRFHFWHWRLTAK